MISAFLNPIFPVFAIMLVAFIFAKANLFDRSSAQAINRFVFYAAVPSLLILLLSGAEFGEVDFRLLGFYFFSELCIYLGCSILFYTLFRCTLAESILLGMTACFVNHVFFVLPIASYLYGDDAVVPITAIIVVDTTIVFAGTTIGLEIASNRSQPWWRVATSFAKNPILMAIAAGLIVNGTGISLHAGITTFTNFVGSAAAPAALFSLGVILAQGSLFTLDYRAFAVTGFKIILHPLLAAFFFYGFVVLDPQSVDTAVLVAAGPCGAMPFVLALQYGVRADSIGRAIVYSTIMSLLTLSVLA